jgi:hypothetical protein
VGEDDPGGQEAERSAPDAGDPEQRRQPLDRRDRQVHVARLQVRDQPRLELDRDRERVGEEPLQQLVLLLGERPVVSGAGATLCRFDPAVE